MHQGHSSDMAERAARCSAAERVLHLVDVENLLGGTTFTIGDVRDLRTLYSRVAGSSDDDLEVIATSHSCAAAAWFGWAPAALRRVRSGPNGADQALLEELDGWVAGRFERVVIGSGDGIFALAAARLQRLGVQVTVVSRPESLSRQLRLAVRDIRPLEFSSGRGGALAGERRAA